MQSIHSKMVLPLVGLILTFSLNLTGADAQAQDKKTPSSSEAAFQVVVMDPLSKPLSCDCVQGYAQRKYEALEKHLEAALDRPVDIIWNGSLASAVKETDGRADLVIGKHSVVMYDADKLERKFTPIASLSGRLGDITQTGLLVVRQDDPAKSVADLKGYEVLFGPEDSAEKSAAAAELLRSNGVEVPEKKKTFGACSEAAVALLKMPESKKAAAVISSYAEPLLEGCGSVKKGDLRVVGQTEPIPFVVAFCPADMDKSTRMRVQQALMAVAEDVELKMALETLDGFVPWQEMPVSESHADQSDAPGEEPTEADDAEAVKKNP